MHFHGRSFPKLILALCLALTVARAEDLQYIFIVDLSPRMAPRHEATVRTVHDLVLTGFHDRIRNGEKFAVWFNGANLQKQKSFVWDVAQDEELARRATALFSDISYSRFDRNRQPLNEAITDSSNFIAFVLTDGYHAITGSTFDSEINAALRENRDTFARVEKPFLVTLLARDGKWISANVHTNLAAAVELPQADTMTEALARVREVVATSPAELAKARAALRKAIVNPPAPIQSPPKAAPAQEPPPIKIATAKIEEPPAAPAPKIIEPTPFVIAVEPPPAKPIEEKPTPAPEPVTTVVATPTPAPVVAEPVLPKPQPIPTNIVQPKVAKTKAAPTTAAAKSVNPRPTRRFPWLVLLSGFLTIGLGGVIAYLRARARENSPGSIITQSLPPYPNRPGGNFPARR